MSVVSNSVALIHLYRIRREAVLKKLFRSVTIARRVYDEVVTQGKSRGYADALRIEGDIHAFITIKEVGDERRVEALVKAGLGKGEAETIVLAKECAGLAILDEVKARTAAEVEGVEFLGTLAVVLRAVREKAITKREAEEVLEDLIEGGFKLSAQVALEFLRKLDEL